jgi:FkbM family methyltransferase
MIISRFLLRFFPALTNNIYNSLSSPLRTFLVNHGIFRSSVQRFAWSLPLRNGKTLRLWVDPTNHFSVDYAFTYAIHDPALKRLEEFLLDHRKDKTVYLDVGANIATSSIYALSCGCDVWMFEPNSEAISFVRSLCDLNGFQPAKIEEVALSNFSGEATLYVSESSYLSSFAKDHAASEGKVRAVDVSTRPLDSYLAELEANYTRAILKIDVEGHEVAVLHGGCRVIEQFRPTVLIEVFSEGANRSEVHDFFAKRGYECYGIDDSIDSLNVARLPDATSMAHHSGLNFAFFPRESMSELNGILVQL